MTRISTFLVVLCILVIGAATAAAKATSPIKRSTKATTSSVTLAEKKPTKSEDVSSTVTEAIRNADSKASSSGAKKTLVVTLSGQMNERGDGLQLFSTQSDSLKDYLDLLRIAREDKNISAIVVRVTASDLGLGTVQELRSAISEVRAKGKKTYGILEDDSQSSYLVASACEQVILPPSGDVMITGVKADGYFLRDMLAKLGLRAEVVHIGKYKSFGEMFTEDDFTTPARENMTQIVEDIYSQIVTMISDSRGISRESVDAIINKGPHTATEALQAKLVDRVSYAEEVLDGLKKDGASAVTQSEYSKDKSSKSEDVTLLSLLTMMNKGTADEKSSKYPEVAVLYAVGSIVPGTDGGMFSQSNQIYADDFIETLDDIQKDKTVRAVILRVNSPGGSAFASDLIWKKIDEVKRTKPVVASMSDVAASGGYYIAMAANRVIAEPGTMTGSIGVVGGKLNLAGGLEKLGIRKQTISKGSFAQLFSETSGFSPDERALMEKMMRKTYDEFVNKAAEGRKLPKEQLLEIAQGKVWMGSRAKEVGLVDENGGLGTAIQETKKLIGLNPDDKVSLVAYPKQVGLVDLLQKAFGSNVTAQVQQSIPGLGMLPRDVQRVLRTAESIGRLLSTEQVLAIMPFIPSIN